MYNYPYNPYQYNQMSQQYIDRLNNTRNTQTYCNNELIRVTGIDGAKAYQTQPNSTVALFDGNEDIFYIKTTDGANFPTIRSFKFVPYEPEKETITNNIDFVNRTEFEEFKTKIEGLINNGKQSISEQSAKPNRKSKPNADSSTI